MGEQTQTREPRLADLTFSMPRTIDEKVEDMRESIRVFKPNASPKRVEYFLDLFRENLELGERIREREAQEPKTSWYRPNGIRVSELDKIPKHRRYSIN